MPSILLLLLALLTPLTAIAQPVDMVPASQRAASQPAATQPASRPTTQPAAGQPKQPGEKPVSKPEPPPKATEASAGPPLRVDVLFTGDIYGRYAWPGCEDRPENKPDIARLAAAVDRTRHWLAQSFRSQPVVVSSGSVTRPDVLGNYVFGSDALAATAVDLLANVGFDGVAVGLYDFGAKPTALGRYMRQMHARHVPLLAGNVTCNKGDARCGLLGGRHQHRYLLLQRNGLRIGVLSVVRDDLNDRIIEFGDHQLQVASAAKWARATIRALRRKHRADLVVVLGNLNIESAAPRGVLDFLRELGDDAPEIVVANAMFERNAKGYLRQIHRGRTLIVGTDRFAQHLGHLVVHLERHAGQLRATSVAVRQIDVGSVPAESGSSRQVADLMGAMCKDLAKPLTPAGFAVPMTQEQFFRYTMEVMRKRTGSELAVLNDSSVADTSFPMSGALTQEKVLRAIRSETGLGYVKLTGARLKVVLGFPHLLKSDTGLHLIGLEKRGRKWYVNGRLLVDGERYKVAITKFVASGGDQHVGLWATEPFQSAKITLREAMIQFFAKGGARAHDDDPTVNAATDFPPLIDKWLMFTGANVGFALSNVAVSNGPAGQRYQLPLLDRANLTSLSFDVDLSFGASTRDHVIELDAEATYGHTWTKQAGDAEATSAETLDRITGNALYRLRIMRNRFGGALYIPDAFAEARLITEFTPSGSCSTCVPAGEDPLEYHYVDLGGTLGLGFVPFPLLFVKAGVVVRGQLNTPEGVNPDILARPGLYLGYLLRRWRLVPDPRHPLQVESRLDFYFTDLSGDLRRELTVQSKIYFSLVYLLNLAVTHRFYVFDTKSRDAAVANDIQVGLTVLFDYRHQTF